MRLRRLGAIVAGSAMALAAGACGRSTPAENASADIVVAPAASATVQRQSPGGASTLPAARRSAPPSPSRAAPSGADPVAVAFAEMVCGAAVKRTRAGLAVGCRQCGDMKPGEDLPEVKDGTDFFRVLAVVRGSFTAQGTDEAVMVLDECSNLLFANEGSGWAPAGRIGHRDPSRCVVAPGKDRRDRLVCTRGFGASTEGTRWELYTEELTAGVEYPETETLVVFRDNGASPCVLGGDHFTALGWASLEAKDVNGDGVDDVVAVLSMASSSVTPSIAAKLARLCAPGPAGPPLFVDPTDYLPAPEPIELRWVTTSRGYTPTAETSTRLRSLPVWVDEPGR